MYSGPGHRAAPTCKKRMVLSTTVGSDSRCCLLYRCLLVDNATMSVASTIIWPASSTDQAQSASAAGTEVAYAYRQQVLLKRLVPSDPHHRPNARETSRRADQKPISSEANNGLVRQARYQLQEEGGRHFGAAASRN